MITCASSEQDQKYLVNIRAGGSGARRENFSIKTEKCKETGNNGLLVEILRLNLHKIHRFLLLRNLSFLN